MTARSHILAVVFVVVSAFPLVSQAETTIHKNKDTGLLTWTAVNDGFKLELIQLLPDFIRAIYYNQGFPEEELKRFDRWCFFGTVIENKTGHTVYFDVADWHHTDEQGRQVQVKTKSQWLEDWHSRGIRFNWTMLPTRGEFAHDDWQQGFTTIKIARDKAFDFTYSWRIGDKTISNTIKDMTCAPASLTQE